MSLHSSLRREHAFDPAPKLRPAKKNQNLSLGCFFLNCTELNLIVTFNSRLATNQKSTNQTFTTTLFFPSVCTTYNLEYLKAGYKISEKWFWTNLELYSPFINYRNSLWEPSLGLNVQVWNWKVLGPEGIYNRAGSYLYFQVFLDFLIHLNYPLTCDLVTDEFFLSPLPISPVGRQAFLIPQIYHLCPLAKALTPHYSLSFTYLVMLLAPCSPLKGELYHLDKVPLSQCSLKPFSNRSGNSSWSKASRVN